MELETKGGGEIFFYKRWRKKRTCCTRFFSASLCHHLTRIASFPASFSSYLFWMPCWRKKIYCLEKPNKRPGWRKFMQEWRHQTRILNFLRGIFFRVAGKKKNSSPATILKCWRKGETGESKSPIYFIFHSQSSWRADRSWLSVKYERCRPGKNKKKVMLCTTKNYFFSLERTFVQKKNLACEYFCMVWSRDTYHKRNVEKAPLSLCTMICHDERPLI